MLLRLEAEFDYDCEPFEVQYLRRYLLRAVRDAVDDGRITQNTDATLVDYKMSVNEVQEEVK